MRKFRGFVVKDVLNDDAFHGRERRCYVRGIGIRLRKVLALDVETTEAAIERGFEHVRNAQSRLGTQVNLPQGFEERTSRVVRDVSITAELVWERSHVAGALHVVLPA